SSTREAVSGRLRRFLVDVARADAAVGTVLLEPLHGLRLLLPLGLAADAEAGEGQGLESALGDVRLTALAHTVGAVLDARERVVDRLELVAITVGEDQVGLAVARVAREVVGVHALVLAQLAALVQLGLHGPQELRTHAL